MKTLISSTVIAALALGLAGCINYEEEITLRAHGSGEATIHYWMNSALVNMAAQQKDQGHLKFTLEEVRKDFEGVEGVTLTDVQVKEEEGNHHVTLQVQFDDVTKLTSVGNRESEETITFTREKGKLIFTRTLQGEGSGPEQLSAAPLLPPAVRPGALWAAEEGAGKPPEKVISFGKEVELEKHLVSGQTTVFDFFSEYCPPCRTISPKLEKLDAAREDLTVIKIDINRPGQVGIDWESPVAKQYQLSSIPHFRIYGPDGKLRSEGEEAQAQVDQWIAEVSETAPPPKTPPDPEDLGKAFEQMGEDVGKALGQMGEQMGQVLQEGQKGMEQAGDAFTKMMEGTMTGASGKLKFTVHFPGEVLEVDPSGTKEGNTARWEFSPMTLMTGGNVEMKAIARAPFPWLPVGVGAGGVLLLVLVGLARRKAR